MVTILRAIAALSLALLAACTPEEPAGTNSAVMPTESSILAPMTQVERAARLAGGGWVERNGLANAEVCFKPTPDAGKSCSKASDCSTFCNAESRTCAPLTPQFGCFQILNDAGQPTGICID